MNRPTICLCIYLLFTYAFAELCAREEAVGGGGELVEALLDGGPAGGSIGLADELEPFKGLSSGGLIPINSPAGMGPDDPLQLLRHLAYPRRGISDQGGAQGGLLLQASGQQGELGVLHVGPGRGLDAVHRHGVLAHVQRNLHVGVVIGRPGRRAP
nr:hypothetical protein Iba_chr09bCG8260 [Ipomoea batatas]